LAGQWPEAESSDVADARARADGPRPVSLGTPPELFVARDELDRAWGAALDPAGRPWVLGGRADQRDPGPQLVVYDGALATARQRRFDDVWPAAPVSMVPLPD